MVRPTLATIVLLFAAACQGEPLAAESRADGVHARSITSEDLACDSCAFEVGDVNETGNVDIWDVVDLIDLLFVDGTPLTNHSNGDVNGDDQINISDVQYLSDYVNAGGPAPMDRACFSNCDGFCAEQIADLPAGSDLVAATEHCLDSCDFVLEITGQPETCRIAF